MIQISLPISTPADTNIRIIIKVGKQGYTRSLFYKNKKEIKELWVDPETTSVVFEAAGPKNTTWKEEIKISC